MRVFQTSEGSGVRTWTAFYPEGRGSNLAIEFFSAVLGHVPDFWPIFGLSGVRRPL